MGHFRFVLLCFFFAGILISRSNAGRPIVRTEVALAPDSPSLAPAESPLGLDHDEGGEQEVHTEKHRHSSDESVAGGGVIIGGLVTITFAAVFCYIRVTRKRDVLRRNSTDFGNKYVMMVGTPFTLNLEWVGKGYRVSLP